MRSAVRARKDAKADPSVGISIKAGSQRPPVKDSRITIENRP
jgi:hypothetical protein